MTPIQNQRELASYCVGKIRGQIARAAALVSDLPADLRRRPREGGGWSIDEILAHVTQTNQEYVRRLEAALAAATSLPSGGVTAPRDMLWRPSLAGRLLLWSVTTTRRQKTPGVFRPERLEPADDVLPGFQRMQQEILDLIERSSGLSWRSTRAFSPASKLVRLNLGDCFLVIAEHGDRHLGQIERLLIDHTKSPDRPLGTIGVS